MGNSRARSFPRRFLPSDRYPSNPSYTVGATKYMNTTWTLQRNLPISQRQDRHRHVQTFKLFLSVSMVCCSKEGWQVPSHCPIIRTTKPGNDSTLRSPTVYQATR